MSTPDPPRNPRRWRVVIITVLCVVGLPILGLLGLFAFVASVNVLSPSSKARDWATRSTMATTLSMVKNYRLEHGSLPSSLAALVPRYMEKLPVDAWKRPFVYTVEPDGGLTLLSLGENGAPGGTGANADIWNRLSPATGAARSKGSWVQRDDTDPPEPKSP